MEWCSHCQAARITRQERCNFGILLVIETRCQTCDTLIRSKTDFTDEIKKIKIKGQHGVRQNEYAKGQGKPYKKRVH